ncbi:MAG: hypothetical protein QOE63_1279 [Acidimicrobiaceae bacterium]
MVAADLPTEPDELTPDWLTAALAPKTGGARVVAVDVTRIDARSALFSRPMHLRLTWEPTGAGPATLVAKLTAPEGEAKQAASEIGVYLQEVRFYEQLAATCGLRAPAAWFVAATDDTVLLLLEDLVGLHHRDAPESLLPTEIAAVLDALAAMHARWWDDPRLDELAWLGQRRGNVERNAARYQRGLPRFLELHGDLLDSNEHALLRHLAASDDVWAIEPARPFTLVHGDPKPSNIFFEPDGCPVFVDWQGVCAAHATADVANALGAALGDQELGSVSGLVDRYVDVLAAAGVDIDRSSLNRRLLDAARHFVVRAVSASVTTDPLFHEAHGVMTSRRIAFARSLE